MTRIGPRHVIQRQGDVLVLMDEGRGTEVLMQVQDAARLCEALPYLLAGGTGVSEVAAERVRQIRQGHTRSRDLQGGPAQALALLRAAAGYLDVADMQADALSSDLQTDALQRILTAGAMPQSDVWPEGWAWKPDVDPFRNLARAGAMIAAAVDVLRTVQAIGESMGRRG